MNAFHVITDPRARSALLFTAFLILLALFSCLSVIDAVSLFFRNKENTALITQLKEKISTAPVPPAPLPAAYLIIEVNQTLAAATLQKNISTLASELGIVLQSVETRQPQTDDPPGSVAVDIQFELDETKLGAFLHKVENFKPAMIIDHLMLAAPKERNAQAAPRLQGSATVIAAWRALP